MSIKEREIAGVSTPDKLTPTQGAAMDRLASSDEVQVHRALGSRARAVGHFLQHLGEMVLAMMLGMVILGIPYGAAMAALGYPHPAQQFPEVSALVMTFNMTVPMVAWMLVRGHSWERAGEMGGAMVVPAVALTVLCVFGVIPHSTLSRAVMIVMLPAMVAVMLYRCADYLHEGMHRQSEASEATRHAERKEG